MQRAQNSVCQRAPPMYPPLSVSVQRPWNRMMAQRFVLVCLPVYTTQDVLSRSNARRRMLQLIMQTQARISCRLPPLQRLLQPSLPPNPVTIPSGYVAVSDHKYTTLSLHWTCSPQHALPSDAMDTNTNANADELRSPASAVDSPSSSGD